MDTNVFLIDGDEAVVGIMGLDFLEGKNPFYFYGQKYGFSLLETAFVAMGIKVFGPTSLAIRASMLLLFIMSFLLFTFNLRKILHANFLAIVIILIVAFTAPAWILPSLKARGGYLTAFFLSNLIIFGALRFRKNQSHWFFLIQGVLFVILYESQRLWLLPTHFLIISIPEFRKYILTLKVKDYAFLILGLVLASLLFWINKIDVYVIWEAPHSDILNLISKITELPDLLVSSLTVNIGFIFLLITQPMLIVLSILLLLFH